MLGIITKAFHHFPFPIYWYMDHGNHYSGSAFNSLSLVLVGFLYFGSWEIYLLVCSYLFIWLVPIYLFCQSICPSHIILPIVYILSVTFLSHFSK